MDSNPVSFLDHLQQAGYHPRSDKHSNALAEAIAADLATHCSKLRVKAAEGKIVYDLNFTIIAGTADWNVDLVLGAPEFGAAVELEDGLIARRSPSSVEIAVEIKSVMTEHRKAVKNRKRDLEAHHEHVHNYSAKAIAGGVLVVNAAERFRSPLRNQVTLHKNSRRLLEHCIAELRSVAARGGQRGYGLEARCAIVVDMDNIDYASTRYVDESPAPQVGDPLHYDAFIQTLCQAYESRF